ncbi:MAG: hypothetical protein VX000_13630, partial [Myxococcota bacterium]|nr:hypothetical protein [Myxococcota bacterium]
DPLSVRALAARLGPALPTRTTAWRWQLAPAPASDVDSLLAALAAVHDGPLPGELEASVRAAGGVLPIQMSAAVRVSLPPDAAPALMRDRVLRPLLQSAHAAPEAFIRPSDIPAVLARLRALGFPVEEAEGPWVGPALPPTGRES